MGFQVTKHSLVEKHIKWLMAGRDYYGLLPADEALALSVAWHYHIELIR